jgi:tetratricopeptide (TPR) repeat protein
MGESADRLAVRAQRSSARGDYPAAIEQQLEAIKILQDELDGLEGAALADEDEALTGEREERAHRLSDNWGKLGGIYRRAEMIPEGIDAYRRGKVIERQYQLDESYNLTNWIALQLLEDPARLPELAGEIDGAIGLIQVQVDGPRRNQWWAWADLGLVHHLGRQVREARGAYEHFRKAGPRRVDYQSVLAVLRQLQRRFSPSAPELTAELDETIGKLESWMAKLAKL